MRNQPAVTVRRADYQPPAYRIERIDLEFDLDPAATRVTTTLVARRNAVPAGTPLILDGEQLQLNWIELDGRRLGPNDYDLRGNQLVVRTDPAQRDAAPLKVRLENTIRPEKNTALMGLYMSNGNFFTQCEAEGFRRITYFPDRPDVMARYTVMLRADKRRVPGAAVQRQPGGRGRPRRRPPLTRSGKTRSRSRPTCSRWWPASWSARKKRSRSAVGREALLQVWVEEGNLDKTEHAMESLKNSIRWDEAALRPGTRPRPLHDRRRRRLQHGRDGKQGPEHLQHQVRAGQPAHRHRRRLCQTSKRWSATNTSTTGPATASPAATGSSCR